MTAVRSRVRRAVVGAALVGTVLISATTATAATNSPAASASAGASAAANRGAGTPTVPATLNGLTVSPEDIHSALAEASGQQYLDGVKLYGIRGANQQLWATLETGTFRGNADPSSEQFLQTVANQVGGSVSIILRAAGHEVFVQQYHQLDLLVWFSGRHMFILAVSQTYDEPKTLLLDALGELP